jgi:hypothetical protein
MKELLSQGESSFFEDTEPEDETEEQIQKKFQEMQQQLLQKQK